MALPFEIAPSTKIEDSKIKIERKRQRKILCKWGRKENQEIPENKVM